MKPETGEETGDGVLLQGEETGDGALRKPGAETGRKPGTEPYGWPGIS
jgi:hypothetical protein